MAPSWPSGGPAGHKEIRMAASDARRAGPVPHDREVPAAGPRGPAWTQAGHLFSFVAVATFVLGLMLLVWPEATTIVVAVIIGISLLVTGLSRLIEGLIADDADGSVRPAQVIVWVAGRGGRALLRAAYRGHCEPARVHRRCLLGTARRAGSH